MAAALDWIDSIYASVTSSEIDFTGGVCRLVLSMLLGAVVGFERKRRGQTAGVRTFSLIAMGACLAMVISIYVPQEYLGLKNGDPGRIAAQVISGIGFLGAGAIIQMKGSVRGLTTAAGIWMVAIIGMAVGLGLYLLSIVACLLILFILVQLERFEHIVSKGSESRIIRLRLGVILEEISKYRRVLAANDVTLNNYYVEYDYEANETLLNLVVLMRDQTNLIKLFGDFRQLCPTKSITLANQLNI